MILRAAIVAGTGGTVNAANMQKPADLEDGYMLYLDALRETGATSSMRVTGVLLKADLDATRRDTTDLLRHWAQTFSDRRLRP